jgi:phage shock protein A
MLDTVKLLKECDAGTKMAVLSIDDVLDKVTDDGLKGLLQESKNHHKELERKIVEELDKHRAEEKEPNPMAKGISWLKTNMKLAMDETDHTIADLMVDGCDMGVKSLSKYLNQYKAADEHSKDIAKRLIKLEEKLGEDIRPYL